jgi:drug/metabolite transporter (DMT)-like permease
MAPASMSVAKPDSLDVTDSNASLARSPAFVARLQLLLAAALWSTSGCLAKSPAVASIPTEWRGLILAGYRAAFAAVLLSPLVPWRQFRWRWAFLPMMLSYAAMNVTYLSALTRTTTAAAIFLQYTAVGWAFLLGTLLLREKATRGDWVALAMAATGVTWILAAEWSGANTAGNLLAVLSGLCYAGVVLSLRGLRDENGPALVVLNNLAGALAVAPLLINSPVSLAPVQWAVVAGMGVLQLGLPYLLFASAVRHVTAQEASLITLVETVLNPHWVWLLWGETASLHTWIGGGLILAGLILRYTVFDTGSPLEQPCDAICEEAGTPGNRDG